MSLIIILLSVNNKLEREVLIMSETNKMMNETVSIIMGRRSIRAYKQDQIKEDELQTILNAGMYAPSAMNQQSWHFTAVQSKDMIHRINEECKNIFLNSGNKQFEERAKSPNFDLFYNAPTLIIVSGKKDNIAPEIDCAIALQNMFLAAESISIGSCWIHGVTALENTEGGKNLIKDLGLPEDYKIVGSGVFGYKAAGSPDPAPRKEHTVNIIK